MPIYDHECKMYRFPSFHETASCEQAKTAQASLRDILAKWPSSSSSSSTVSTTSRSSISAASPPTSSSSSTISTPSPPPSSVSEQKRPSNASEHKWISNCPRRTPSSTSAKSTSPSHRTDKSSSCSTHSAKSQSSRTSVDVIVANGSASLERIHSWTQDLVLMGSSKGEPDDPKLREQCKEEVKNMEKGGGKGSWSAWKAGELARLYESRGGGYKDTSENKNKPQKGYPERKDGKDNTGVAGQKKDEKKDEKKKDGAASAKKGGKK